MGWDVKDTGVKSQSWNRIGSALFNFNTNPPLSRKKVRRFATLNRFLAAEMKRGHYILSINANKQTNKKNEIMHNFANGSKKFLHPPYHHHLPTRASLLVTHLSLADRRWCNLSNAPSAQLVGISSMGIFLFEKTAFISTSRPQSIITWNVSNLFLLMEHTDRPWWFLAPFNAISFRSPTLVQTFSIFSFCFIPNPSIHPFFKYSWINKQS